MNWTPLLNSIVYSGLGLLIFLVGFWVVDKLTPYDLWHELIKEKNLPLAVVVGAISLGLCLIIAAAIHG